jgi:hypothetical protein
VNGVSDKPSVRAIDHARTKAIDAGKKLMSTNPSFVRPFDNSQRSNSSYVMYENTGSRPKLESVKRKIDRPSEMSGQQQIFVYNAGAAIEENSEGIEQSENNGALATGRDTGPYQAIMYKNGSNIHAATTFALQKSRVPW